LSDELDEALASVPCGYWYSVILAGWAKAVLTSQDLSVADRLAMLEGLSTCVHGSLTPAVLAAVAPVGETVRQIIEEALRLDLDANSESGELSFQVLTRPDVFANLLKLEPSLFDAIRLMSRGSPTGVAP
jgi:hypothetical protein